MKKKIKICYLWPEFIESGVGGAVTHMLEFLNAWEKLGNDFFVISPKNFEYLRDLGKVYSLDCNSRVEFLFNVNFFKFNKLKEIVEKEDPDVIYQRHTGFTDYGLRLAREFNKPFFLEFNGPIPWIIKHWTGKKRKIFSVFLSPLANYYEKKVLEGADVIFVNSNPMKRMLLEMGIDESKIAVNPNGVNIEKFNPKVKGDKIRMIYNIPKDAIVVGFISTFGKWHGSDILALAAREVVKKNKNIWFLFMGDGMLRKQTEEIVKGCERVIFTGIVPRERVPEYLAACDILVNPTRSNPDKTEFFGSPTKIFEYGAMGKAIISSSIGQMKEIFENGKDAILIEPDSKRELVNNILILAKNSNLRKRLGRNIREKIKKEYTWKNNAKRISEMLKL